jgi:hypothetical protein
MIFDAVERKANDAGTQANLPIKTSFEDGSGSIYGSLVELVLVDSGPMLPPIILPHRRRPVPMAEMDPGLRREDVRRETRR